MKRIANLVMAAILLSTFAAAQHGHGRGHQDRDDDDDEGYSQSSPYVFSRTDRDRIMSCMGGGDDYDRRGLPPGLAKKQNLPPGLQKQLERNGHLPPGLEKKMQPLPHSCEVRLPRLPSNVTRVVVGNYVILRDIHDRILDLIELNRR